MIEQPFLYHNGGYWTFIQPDIAEKFNDDYWEAIEKMNSAPEKAEELFKLVIWACGNGHVDALLHLGFLYKDTKKPIEGNALIHKAHNIALHAIPAKFNSKKEEISWSIIENRPFLRTFHAVGLEYIGEEQYEKALEKFTFMLDVNKADNPGVRYLLPECYLYLQRYDDFIALYEKTIDGVNEGHSIEYDYSLFYALYKIGDFEKAKVQFKKAKLLFPHVASELIKNKHLFPYNEFERPLSGIPIGSRQEAFEYWNRTKKLWAKEKDLKKFMTQH